MKEQARAVRHVAAPEAARVLGPGRGERFDLTEDEDVEPPGEDDWVELGLLDELVAAEAGVQLFVVGGLAINSKEDRTAPLRILQSGATSRNRSSAS